MNTGFVTPAQAGVPLPSQQNSGSPAFAGMTIWGLIAALFLLLAGPAAAQTFPPLTGRVVDQAELLRPEQELDLTSKLAALEAQTGRQFVVATIRSLEGRTIEDYGYRLGRAWAIGDKERDDGVILLVAPKERKVRIETGYGARVFLTDAVSSIIIREDILPRFKEGDMAGGIMAGAERVIATLQLPPEEAARRAEEIGSGARRAEVDVNPVPVFMIVIIFFVIVSSIARRARGRRYHGKGRRRGGFDSGDLAILLWGLEALSRSSRGRGGWGGGGGFSGGGGWGGGGGFSGGGGSFGGGGASGSW